MEPRADRNKAQCLYTFLLFPGARFRLVSAPLAEFPPGEELLVLVSVVPGVG